MIEHGGEQHLHCHRQARYQADMDQIINFLKYDTDTATLVHRNPGEHSLYKTPNARYFLLVVAEGTPVFLEALSKDEALKWLMDNTDVATVEATFTTDIFPA